MGKNIIKGCGIKFDGWHHCGETIHGAERAVYCDKCLSASKSDGEAKFTKGPWILHKAMSVINENVEYVNIESENGTNIHGMETYGGEIALANAHLIAAAPEMYEMLDMLTESSNPEDMKHLIVESRKVIIELLAKARGERND